jgi:hypothetical protein
MEMIILSITGIFALLLVHLLDEYAWYRPVARPESRRRQMPLRRHPVTATFTVPA